MGYLPKTITFGDDAGRKTVHIPSMQGPPPPDWAAMWAKHEPWQEQPSPSEVHIMQQLDLILKKLGMN
jgi:hypothetical protein